MPTEYQNILYQLHLSYLQARKNKRNTYNQLKFEIDQEAYIHQLAIDIDKRCYKPKPSIAFIVNKPVQREVFAADFSDRIIHHLIYRIINPFVENKLIHDTYSCRIGKGTLYGINRLKHFIRSASDNYRQSAYILKLDVSGYFMNMYHSIIYEKVSQLFPHNQTEFNGISIETILYLIEKTIFNKVCENCIIKGNKNNWIGLPSNKSLFNNNYEKGLPIGNLTSQIFGNIYLNELDHFVKRKLKIKYYGRYVDDMVFVHNDKEYLKSIISTIDKELHKIGMQVHPNKIILNNFSEGVLFLGHQIKPYCSYISNRTKSNLYKLIDEVNLKFKTNETKNWKEIVDIRNRLNSYLNTLSHTNSFLLRKEIFNKLCYNFYQFYYKTDDYKKLIINHDYWQWHYTQISQYTN